MSIKKYYIAVIAVLFLTGCSGAERNSQRKTVPIPQAREQLTSDMEELKRGDYANLKCDDIEPIFTDSDEWYTLHLVERGKVCDQKGKKLAQVMRDNYKEMEKWLGDDITGGTMEVFFRSTDEYRKEYNEELLKEVEQGEYDGERYYCMFFDNASFLRENEKSKDTLSHVSLTLLWDLGGTMLLSGNLQKSYPELYDMDRKTVSRYYRNCSSEQLKERYVMCDGNKVSIQESIEMAEDYMSKHLRQDNFMKKVFIRVNVLKVGDKNYMYNIDFVNEWDGMPFDANGSLTTESTTQQQRENKEIDYDIECVSFIGRDLVEDYVDYASGEIVEETGEPITETITLKQALEQVSQSIGNVSQYQIKSIELAYRKTVEVVDLVRDNEYNAYPVWEIEAVNLSDKMETRFYVNIKDGTMEVDRFQ